MPVVSNDLFIFFDLFSISLFKIVKEKERAYGDVLSCGEAETLGASLSARTPQRKHVCYLTLRRRVIRVRWLYIVFITLRMSSLCAYGE